MTESTVAEEQSSVTSPTSLEAIYGEWDGTGTPALATASRLYDRIDELDVSQTAVLMTFELVLMEQGCSEENRLVLFYTILASWVAKKRGSVRFALSADGDRGTLADRLNRYLPGLSDVGVADAVEGLTNGDGTPDWDQIARRAKELFRDPARLALVGGPGESAPLIVQDDQLYHQRSFAEENRLAGAISDRLLDGNLDSIPVDRPFDGDDLEDGLEELHNRSSFELTAEQQYGVLTALCTPLSLITGGPGTGKTFIVITIVRMLTELGIPPNEIAIAAPTGKAANRLDETITQELNPTEHDVDRTIADERKDPGTLHRLLGYSEKREDFYYHENRPLPYQYVLVDEASMIDLSLMEQLFAATGEGTSLCLLGDANQLPAVESGAVFRDLVPAELYTDVPWRDLAVKTLSPESPSSPEPLSRQSVRLSKNFRVETGGDEAENLLSVSAALNRGGDDLVFVESDAESRPPTGLRIRDSLDDIGFSGLEQFEPPTVQPPDQYGFSGTQLEQILRFWYDRWYGEDSGDAGTGNRPAVDTVFSFRAGSPDDCEDELHRVFDAYNRAQLLSVTRRTPMGSREINRYLHQHHRSRLDRSGSDRTFVPGEPVIMNRNDYDRGLFNGDQGIVLTIEQKRSESVQPMAVFPGIETYRIFHLGPLRSQLNHAFALTIHKSQGSEFGTVGLVLPGRNVPLLTRELLYTGVTRARESVTVFGSRQILKLGAGERDERNSGLLDRLKD
ncbi:MAG: ATP-dependent RecD-like DNA helicase [bacterium]